MKNFLILSLLLAFLTTEVCAQWKPAGDKIKTQWANKINTSAVLPEYPLRAVLFLFSIKKVVSLYPRNHK